MKKYLMILLGLLVFFSESLPVFAEQAREITLQVEGSAPVVKSDEARARKEAVGNALEKAIVQTSISLLSGQKEDEAFQTMKSIIIERVNRYINHYRIVSESQHNNEYAVIVNVVIGLASLRDDLLQVGVLQKQEEKESTLVLLKMQNVKKYSDFNRFRNYLRSRPKTVRSIFPCRLEWRQFQCRLIIEGPLQKFWDDMDSTGQYLTQSVKSSPDGVEVTMQIKEED